VIDTARVSSLPLVLIACCTAGPPEVSIAVAAVAGVVLVAVPAALMVRALRQALAVARYDVEHDALTGLANRKAFYGQAGWAVSGNLSGHRLAVALVDVDDFKQINDRLGHGAGDAVLHVLARRLQEAAGSRCLVARLGGDEFAAIAGLDEASRRATSVVHCTRSARRRSRWST